MQIHRIPKHAPGYTILDNGHVVRKHSLSWAARGLLSYLLSLPDGAREDVRTLAAKSVEGRTTVSRALRELEQAGHYIRRTERDPLTGQVRTTVSVHEVPVTGKAVHTVPPLPVSPAAGLPGAGTAVAGKTGNPSGRVRNLIRKEVEGPSVLPSRPVGPDAELSVGSPGSLNAPSLSRPTEGMELLLELGRCEPRMALAGKPLADQAARVEGLLAGGWTRDALTGILSAPLPEKITRSVGAVLAARLLKVPPFPSAHRPAEATAPAPVPRPSKPECAGRDGMCGRYVSAVGKLCSACRS
ncbi:helix-turn-helix domain-containing protein [Kitasatospora sp. NPDC088548]|uniref:helix-turn-helix domain-containing protein n=1 Tax=Kitasatospora sp. NPDC088548 TaxID=3364075 RepID=UPI0037F8D051